MTKLGELVGTSWSGRGELWLDPLGNEASLCDCSIEVGASEVTYRWSHEGKAHTGRIALTAGGAEFTDTFHAEGGMTFVERPATWCLFELFGTWTVGDSPPWGWRIYLALRPSDELVLGMVNIAPWGEEARAVRMTCTRRP